MHDRMTRMHDENLDDQEVELLDENIQPDPTDLVSLTFLLPSINRGSYMSAHVLLNLLYELEKRDKMQGLLNIL